MKLHLRFAAALVIGLVPTVFVACGSSEAGPLAELGGNGEGGGGDASNDDADSTIDSAVDATPADAAVDAGPKSFCALQAPGVGRCEDFDDGALVPGDTMIEGGASLAIASGTAKSPPNALAVTVPSVDAGFANAVFRTSVTQKSSARFVVAFDYRPDQVTPSGILVIARIFLSADHQITIELASPDGPVVREDQLGAAPSSTSHPFTALPPANQWTRYELSLDRVTNELTVRAAGVELTSFTLASTDFGFLGANFGLTANVDAPYSARFDDVVLDLP